MASPHPSVVGDPRALRFWWSEADRHQALTGIAAAGLVIAGILAAFGLPPVDLHLPLHHLGIMDPACGMTRGVRLVARGDLIGAMRFNPAAPLVPLGGVALLVRHAVGRLTGRWADLRVRWTPTLAAVVLLGLALLWARQQANVDLLRNR